MSLASLYLFTMACLTSPLSNENLLEDVYFSTLTSEQLKRLAEYAYYDRKPYELSLILTPIAFYYKVSSDYIKNELINHHLCIQNNAIVL